MNADELLLSLAKETDAGRRADRLALAMLLPVLQMEKKLLERKEGGKKPFSLAFHYEKRRTDLIDLEERILSGEELASLRPLLTEAGETALLAGKECSDVGLKEDFRWMEEQISIVLSSYNQDSGREDPEPTRRKT